MSSKKLQMEVNKQFDLQRYTHYITLFQIRYNSYMYL